MNRRIRCVGSVLLLAVSACGGSGSGDSAGLGNGAGGSGSGSGPTPPGTVVGSVGDGPATDARLVATDANGASVSTVSNGLARYELSLPTDIEYPVLVTASGGLDRVTNRPLDFTLRTVVLSRDQTVANLSPITTLIVGAASCAAAEPSQADIDAATSTLFATLSFGLDSALVPDPITTRVTAGNVAATVKANEAVAETIRRTAVAMDIKGQEAIDGLVQTLACDLADGAIDGVGMGADARLAATFNVAMAPVLTELIQNALHITDVTNQIATATAQTAAIDRSIALLEPSATDRVGDVAILQALLDQALRPVAAAAAVRADSSLIDLSSSLDEAAPGSPRDIDLPSSADMALSLALEDVAGLDDPSVVLGLSNIPPVPTVTLTASPTNVIGRSSPGEIRLSWVTSNAVACSASGGWNGVRPTANTGTQRFFPASVDDDATYLLTCIGPGGARSANVTVYVVAFVAGDERGCNLVEADEPVTITFRASNAVSCTDGSEARSVPSWKTSPDTVVAGSEITALSSDVTFALSCDFGTFGTGSSTVELEAPVFVRSAEIRWIAPTLRVDGSALTSADVRRYRVLVGTESRRYDPTKSLLITGSNTETIVSGLSGDPGSPVTHYFAVQAVDQRGFESVPSNEVSVSIPKPETIAMLNPACSQ